MSAERYAQAARRERSRLAGLTTASRYDGATMTAPARRGWLAKLAREVEAEAAAQGLTLAPPELARRADAKMRAHLAKIRAAHFAKHAKQPH